MFELGGRVLRTVTVRIPDELHKKLKVKMAEEEMTIQSLIIEFISEKLDYDLKEVK